MTKLILLAYASQRGSTQEVAETIAGALRDAGLQVDLQPARDITSLDTYNAVVLGASIYNAKWHADAHRFLSQHQAALIQRPVCIFALGPLTTNKATMQQSRNQLDRELAQYPWLKPAALEVFIGKYDPAKFGFVERLLYGSSIKDHRDWDAIRAWANALPAHLAQG